MFKSRRNVPDLRRRQKVINLENINLHSCLMMVIILSVFIISVLCVSAYPNSNIPAGI